MIIIDGEFTGLDHNKHALISLGAIDFNNPDRQFYGECRVWDGATYEQEALDINGFSVDEITDSSKKSLEDMIGDFDLWLKGCSKPQILVGQNPKTDIDFLKKSYQISGLDYPLGHRSIDMHTVVFMKYLDLGMDIPMEKGNYKINLDQALDFVGISGGEPKPHNALMGAKCEAEVLSRVLYGKGLLKEFDLYPVSSYLKKA